MRRRRTSQTPFYEFGRETVDTSCSCSGASPSSIALLAIPVSCPRALITPPQLRGRGSASSEEISDPRQ